MGSGGHRRAWGGTPRTCSGNGQFRVGASLISTMAARCVAAPTQSPVRRVPSPTATQPFRLDVLGGEGGRVELGGAQDIEDQWQEFAAHRRERAEIDVEQ